MTIKTVTVYSLQLYMSDQAKKALSHVWLLTFSPYTLLTSKTSLPRQDLSNNVEGVITIIGLHKYLFLKFLYKFLGKCWNKAM